MSVRRTVAANLLAAAADLATGRLGDLVWRTDTSRLRVHTGTGWVDAAPSASVLDRVEYTPTLGVDSGTAPTLGAGATAQGRYRALGQLLVGQARIILGTGATPGSGTYRVSLPAPPGMSGSLGYGYVHDASAVAWRSVSLEDAGSGLVYLITSAEGRVSSAVPWTPGPGDQIVWSFAYERS